MFVSLNCEIVFPTFFLIFPPDIQTRREEVQEELTETDLDKAVNIRLSETDTIWLIDMRGVCISAETDEAETIKAKNEAYKEVRGGFRGCFPGVPPLF